MTTVNDRTTEAPSLADRVKTHLDALDALYRALPDPNDEPTPNGQERAARARASVEARRGTLRTALDRVQTCDRRAAPVREWHGILLDAEHEFDRQRAALDALPGSAQRERFREVDAVRDSLKVIRNGRGVGRGDGARAKCPRRLLARKRRATRTRPTIHLQRTQ
jgi:hypothetical protein